MGLRRFLSWSVAVLILAAGTFTSCTPSLSNVVSGVQLYNAAKTVDAYYEVRKEPAPLAGTYEVTFEFESRAPVTVYARTFANKNMPLVQAKEPEKLADRLGLSGPKYDLDAGYMTNVVGFETLGEIPDTIPEHALMGGFLSVFSRGDTLSDGSIRYDGTLTLLPYTAATEGVAGEVAAGMREVLRLDRDRAEQQATPMVLHADGTVVGATRILYEGRAVLTVRYRRISPVAFQVDAKHLERPTAGALAKGYLDPSGW